ncbi:MAG: GNAT family N-acetyltransferase [Thermoplasmata archaeon]|nr:MAG: GNAT family N-acetyltransferase [Thermoplasmata archaeon]
MHVIEGSEALAEACMNIARALRTHFDDNAMVQMPKDLRSHRLYVAEDEGDVVGFLTVKSARDGEVEISWMGVHPGHQGKGIGRALVSEAERDLVSEGVLRLAVRTLADTVEYEPYEATRAFYRAVGFVHQETIDPYPEWGPGNPCAVYIKDLG